MDYSMEKPLQKLLRRVLLGFQTHRNNKALGSRSRSRLHKFLAVWKPDGTLTLVFEILLLKLITPFALHYLYAQQIIVHEMNV